MGRKGIVVTDEMLVWLRAAVDGEIAYSDMAAHVGCCTDTLKRILHRHGIADFEGAKYQKKEDVTKWKRPCSDCGSTKPRPKWQFRCNPCLERRRGSSNVYDQ